jgi:hypothetical protein
MQYQGGDVFGTLNRGTLTGMKEGTKLIDAKEFTLQFIGVAAEGLPCNQLRGSLSRCVADAGIPDSVPFQIVQRALGEAQSLW